LPAASDAIWRVGLKDLAGEVDKYGCLPGMIAEFFDKLLVGTGECQDWNDIFDRLKECGIEEAQANYAADVYSVVDMVRTSGAPTDNYWSPNFVDMIKADLTRG